VNTPTLKLHYTSASPFVRKVVLAAIELGLDHRLEFVPAANPTVPTARNPAIAADNPLSKVPTLVLADGEVLFDSVVICEYLDTIADRPHLFPPPGPVRWKALRLNALADGMLDSGVSVRLERIRPAGLQWPDWIEGHLFKIRGALDLLEHEPILLDGPLHIGQIALGAALPWLAFREVYTTLPESHPRVASWLSRFEQRHSMQRTKPA